MVLTMSMSLMTISALPAVSVLILALALSGLCSLFDFISLSSMEQKIINFPIRPVVVRYLVL